MAELDTPQDRVTSVMEDPSSLAVARVYAEAFLNAAASVGVQDLLEEFASFLEDVLEKHPEFESILLSGILNRDQKIAVIDRVVKPFGSGMLTNFLRVLARHDRLDLLPQILNEAQLKFEISTGKQRVQLTSAVELSQETLNEIQQSLDQSLSFEPILETRVDSSLLGGVVIQIGDTVYDSSLSTRMKQLREQLRHRSIHEIQSGRDRFSDPEGN